MTNTTATKSPLNRIEAVREIEAVLARLSGATTAEVLEAILAGHMAAMPNDRLDADFEAARAALRNLHVALVRGTSIAD